MLSLRAQVDLGVMAMKRYSAFPKAPALLEPHQLIVYISYPGHMLGESYPSAEIQSVYSAAQADWTKEIMGQYFSISKTLFLNNKL